MSLFKDIKEFHEKFGLEYNGPPRLIDNVELSDFRTEFMREELDEYEKALSERDGAKALDALVDLVYVAIGTAYLHGYDFDEAWRRVHQANMKKVRANSASDSKRGTAFDVVKPVGWLAPELDDLV